MSGLVQIKKIYNNNVVLVDYERVTKIVTGSGVGYKKKIGDAVEKKLIKEQYVLEQGENTRINANFFENMSRETLEAIEKALAYASEALNTTFSNSTKLAIMDHLYYSIKRYNEGSSIEDEFLGDIKRIYQFEYTVAKNCVNIINDSLGIKLSESECSIITIHFINVTYNSAEGNKAVKEAKSIDDILNIIQRQYRKEFNRDSERYGGLRTHLRYLIRRALKGEKSGKNLNLFLYNYYKGQNREAYLCALKIKNYIKDNLEYDLIEDDILYLMIHIINTMENA